MDLLQHKAFLTKGKKHTKPVFSIAGTSNYKISEDENIVNLNFASIPTLHTSVNGNGNVSSSTPKTKAKRKKQRKRKHGKKAVEPAEMLDKGPPSKKPKTKINRPVPTISLEKAGCSTDVVDITHEDCSKTSEQFFDWLIHPFPKEKFLSEFWEKQPLLIKRNNSFYYHQVFSCAEFDKILRKDCLLYSKNIDVTEYKDGERQTFNPTGRAFASSVWDNFENGYSIRLLNPQTYSRSVWHLCSVLQGFFGCFVGANVYLTPKGTQGFAPHYDDIEAFVIQLEGVKKWKIYKPRTTDERLPRYSSPNFKEEELSKPLLEVELHPGDLLYFPRGFIHQASSSEDIHSLHMTISTYQKNSWGDFMEKLLPAALQIAISEDEEFRQGLPLNYLQHLGPASLDDNNRATPERDNFMEKLNRLLKKVIRQVPVDATADQMAKNYIHCSLPPVLSRGEQLCSVYGSGERWQNDRVVDKFSWDPDMKIRLVRPDVLRIVREEESIRVYYSTCNSRVYQAEDPFYSEVAEPISVGIEHLIKQYPNFVAIEDLPMEEETQQMELACWLYDCGLIHTEEPVPIDED